MATADDGNLKEARNLPRGVYPSPDLPIIFKGQVVQGFGRGSKELGCPTANIPIAPYESILEQYPAGVYYAFASFEEPQSPYQGLLFATALSIGWNPYYKNERKTIEAHLIHKFTHDFYGQEIRITVVGYMRPEWNFPSLGELIQAIQDDIHFAAKKLAEDSLESYRESYTYVNPLDSENFRQEVDESQ